MKPLIWGIILCIALTVGGNLLIKLAGFHADWSGAMSAMAVAIAALVLAGLPPILARGISPMTSVQVGLASTLIHMFVLLVAAAAALLAPLPVGPSFVFWLMGLYVVTLVALVALIIGSNRAPVSMVSAAISTAPQA